jgi:hypothetical protein
MAEAWPLELLPTADAVQIAQSREYNDRARRFTDAFAVRASSAPAIRESPLAIVSNSVRPAPSTVWNRLEGDVGTEEPTCANALPGDDAFMRITRGRSRRCRKR